MEEQIVWAYRPLWLPLGSLADLSGTCISNEILGEIIYGSAIDVSFLITVNLGLFYYSLSRYCE